jgi:hypothetical protein
MALLWTYSDQQSIKPISENNEPDWEQLAIEVQLVKLKELTGEDFYQDIINNPTSTWNKKLIDGGTYTKNNITYQFSGLKYVLAFLFMERYVMEDNAQDTFVGYIQNELPEGRHISLGQKKEIQKEMRKIVLQHWTDCQSFVCENSTEFPYAKFTTSGTFYFV